MAHLHKSDFIKNDLSLLLVFGFNEFESTDEAIGLSFDLKYLCEAALTKLTKDIIAFAWISVAYFAHSLELLLKVLWCWQFIHKIPLTVSLRIVHSDEHI